MNDHDARQQLSLAEGRAQIGERLLDLLAEMASLEKLLTQVAGLAVDLVPGCDLASVTVIRDGAPTTVASSDDRATRVDETQYASGEGPCLRAARTAEPVQHDNISQAWLSEVSTHSARPDRQEPSWRSVARCHGVTASLSMPVASSTDIFAALNMYRLTGTGWSTEALDLGEYLAEYAGSALTIAYRLNSVAQAES